MDNKISIVIPAYNVENVLSRTLESVLAQTYRNIEVVLVDDGSTDGTGTIIDSYASKDSRVRPIHKENGGVTSARLAGIAGSSGEWIGFVDGDDYVESGMFAHLLRSALEHNADISHCGYQMVFPDGRIDYYYNTGCLVKQDRITGLKDLMSGLFVEPGLCNKLFHKSLFHSLLCEDVMPTDIKINEDLLMNYYLFKAAKRSVFEDVCPYHYVLREGSAATSKLNTHKLRDPLLVTRIIMEDAPQELQGEVYRKLIRQLIVGATMSSGRQKELIRPYRREVRLELRQRLWRTLRGDECHFPLKMMALWAAISPLSYGWVHIIYGKIRGYDKKYQVK